MRACKWGTIEKGFPWVWRAGIDKLGTVGLLLILAAALPEFVPSTQTAAAMAAAPPAPAAGTEVDPTDASQAGAKGDAKALPQSILYIVPHFHWDLAYYQPESSELSLGVSLLQQYVRLAAADPDFKFIVDQIPLLQAFFEQAPEEGEQLRELVRARRVEITGGLYVQPDENLPSGEALIRQGIYGIRWVEQTLGVRPRYIWDIDSFGHLADLPQIASHLGLEYLVFSYARSDINQPTVRDFWWEGADGSRLLVNTLYPHYNNGSQLGRGTDYDQAKEFARVEEAFRQQEKFNGGPGLFLMMDGDDMTPPPYSLTRLVREWNASHPDRQLRVATPSEYFTAVAAHPSQIGEMGGEFQVNWNGFFSSRIADKQANRRLENGLLAAEKLATLATLLSGGYVYPHTQLDEAWVNVLLNQFHDYLAGSTIDPARPDFNRRVQVAQAQVTTLQTQAWAQLVGGAATAVPASNRTGEPLSSAATARPLAYCVWNPSTWVRSSVWVQLPVESNWGSSFTIIDERGAELLYQLVPASALGLARATAQAVFRLSELPALGYRVVTVLPGRKPAQSPAERPISGVPASSLCDSAVPEPQSASAPPATASSPSATTAKTFAFQIGQTEVRLSPSGSIASLAWVGGRWWTGMLGCP